MQHELGEEQNFPAEPRRRLVWFGGATLVAGALAIRAYMTA